jgi:predicted nucleic acid-binding protein
VKIIYVDTSVLVCVFFTENHPLVNHFSDTLNNADEVLSSSLLEAEFLSVIKREGLPLKESLTLLEPVSLIIPERSLLVELKHIFDLSYLRGADAYHLATALYLDPSAKNLSFLTADKEQQDAAQKLGFST